MIALDDVRLECNEASGVNEASSVEAAGVQMAQSYLFSAPLTARGLKDYHAFTTRP